MLFIFLIIFGFIAIFIYLVRHTTKEKRVKKKRRKLAIKNRKSNLKNRYKEKLMKDFWD